MQGKKTPQKSVNVCDVKVTENFFIEQTLCYCLLFWFFRSPLFDINNICKKREKKKTTYTLVIKNLKKKSFKLSD